MSDGLLGALAVRSLFTVGTPTMYTKLTPLRQPWLGNAPARPQFFSSKNPALASIIPPSSSFFICIMTPEWTELLTQELCSSPDTRKVSRPVCMYHLEGFANVLHLLARQSSSGCSTEGRPLL